jgi:cell division septum initiation protein DivIVA
LSAQVIRLPTELWDHSSCMDEAKREANRIVAEARKEAKAILAEAKEAADSVLAEAQGLAASLRTRAEALTAEADRLVQNVQLTHRELLAELRVPGLAARDQARAADQAQPSEPETTFELPNWIGRENRGR